MAYLWNTKEPKQVEELLRMKVPNDGKLFKALLWAHLNRAKIK